MVRAELVDRMRREVAGWTVTPLHAGLFGSFARGEAGVDSDIDVLLVRPANMGEALEDTWLAQVDRLDRQIRAWTGNAVQIVDITPATLGRMAGEHDPLIDSWRADHVHLHGERLLDLLRRLR